MQHKQPKFSGILVVAVLMVLVLFFVSLSPLLAASGNKDTTYSEIYYYFENQQVTSFRLDLGTGSLEMWLKEGKAALPESNAATTMPSGGLLSMGSTDNDTLPANGGTVYMTYQWWIGKCNELTIHKVDPVSHTPEDKFSACQVDAIADQVWAEGEVERQYTELKQALVDAAAPQDVEPGAAKFDDETHVNQIV